MYKKLCLSTIMLLGVCHVRAMEDDWVIIDGDAALMGTAAVGNATSLVTDAQKKIDAILENVRAHSDGSEGTAITMPIAPIAALSAPTSPKEKTVVIVPDHIAASSGIITARDQEGDENGDDDEDLPPLNVLLSDCICTGKTLISLHLHSIGLGWIFCADPKPNDCTSAKDQGKED